MAGDAVGCGGAGITVIGNVDPHRRPFHDGDFPDGERLTVRKSHDRIFAGRERFELDGARVQSQHGEPIRASRIQETVPVQVQTEQDGGVGIHAQFTVMLPRGRVHDRAIRAVRHGQQHVEPVVAVRDGADLFEHGVHTGFMRPRADGTPHPFPSRPNEYPDVGGTGSWFADHGPVRGFRSWRAPAADRRPGCGA